MSDTIKAMLDNNVFLGASIYHGIGADTVMCDRCGATPATIDLCTAQTGEKCPGTNYVNNWLREAVARLKNDVP